MMHDVEVMLPGGLLKDGNIKRQAKFRPLTGRIEETLIELAMDPDRPKYVTAVLNSTLHSIGDESVDVKCVADLCVADRQYLMLRLAAMLDSELMWLKIDCAYCDSSFDVDIRRCDLPVKESGPGYPQVSLSIKDWVIDARVPTGADQECIAGLQSEEKAMKQLLQNCIQLVNGSPPGGEFINRLTAQDIEMIDNALDDMSPAVCNQLLVTCPECNREQLAEIDHYALNSLDANLLYDEVHTLASHYHWSETDILDLPQARRRLYLRMINQSCGITE